MGKRKPRPEEMATANVTALGSAPKVSAIGNAIGKMAPTAAALLMISVKIKVTSVTNARKSNGFSTPEKRAVATKLAAPLSRSALDKAMALPYIKKSPQLTSSSTSCQ